MEWGASRILALRKHAGMTQAQFAQWLGVSIKQVKYLEHQRRNPSGPARRLLDILAGQFHFNGTEAVLVLGTDTTRLRRPAGNPKPPIADSAKPHDDGNRVTKPPEAAPGPNAGNTDPEAPATSAVTDDDAFVWR
jgi:transcriptional regulator with XRE-family HTH domain